MQEKNVECKIPIAKPYYGSLFFRKYINRIGHFKKNTQANMQSSSLIAYRVKFQINPKIPIITDSIMKDLTCGDLERQNKALTAADEFLKRHKAENGEDSEEECRRVKTKSDRTVISKSKEKRRLDPSTALNQMVRFCVHK